MSSMIEVERRSVLDQVEREKILKYMSTLGQVQQFTRVMIEFSGVDRTFSAKIRINDGKAQLVAKTGSLEDESRREAEIELTDSLEVALNFMGILGHTHASVARRIVHEVVHDGLTISLRDIIDGHSGKRRDSLFEVEAIAEDDADVPAILERLDQFLESHQLTRIEGDAWKQWVDYNHTKVDLDYTYSPEAAAELAASLASA